MGCVRSILLIDGVGHPKILEADAHEYPQIIGHARENVASGPDRIATFVCTGEIDQDGRMVYRQEGTGALLRTAYLTLQPIEPFNAPRLEP